MISNRMYKVNNTKKVKNKSINPAILELIVKDQIVNFSTQVNN